MFYLEGVQLLCMIDKGMDACRYLQTYGNWDHAAWLAKVCLFFFCMLEWWGNRQGKRLSPLRLWVRARYTHVRRISQRSAKSRAGFSLGTPVFSHLKCWQGWLRIKIDTSQPFHRSCAPLTLGRKAAPSICLRLDLVSCVLRNSARPAASKDDEHLPTLYL